MDKNYEQKAIGRGDVLRTLGGALYLLQFLFLVLFYNIQANIMLLGLGWILLLPSFLLQVSSLSTLNSQGGVANAGGPKANAKLVDTGVYAIVRHPLYTGWMMMSSALAMISQHWISVVLTVLQSIAVYDLRRHEEISNAEEFGDDYASYQDRVPMADLIVGCYRCLSRRSKQP